MDQTHTLTQQGHYNVLQGTAFNISLVQEKKFTAGLGSHFVSSSKLGVGLISL